MTPSIYSLFVLGAFLTCIFTPVILYLTGAGEIFFVQKRLGRGGKEFGLIKFAMMLKDSPNLGTGTVTLKNDSRILTVGRILRKTKVNELPQLFNIFMGDMSVVGPRPQTSRCFDVFPENLKVIITKIRPGLSGLGPIVFRNEESILADNEASVDFYDQVIAPYKGEVEAYYVERQNIYTYFAIIILTVWVVLFPKSELVWKIFSHLPTPPDSLQKHLNYTVR